MALWADRQILIENARTEAFRSHIRRFCTPPSEVTIEKVVEVYDSQRDVQVGVEVKAIIPTATIVRAGENEVILPGSGQRFSRAQAERLLNSVQKGQLTKALNQNLEARKKNLTPV